MARSSWSSELAPRLARGCLALLAAVGLARFDAGPAVAGPLTPPTSGPLQALITTSELVVGPNRFAFALVKHETQLEDARVAVRTYTLQGQEAELTAETPALYHKLEVVEDGRRVHVHPDGTRHLHAGSADIRGIYVAQVTLARAGPWGLEILAQQGDGPVESTRLRVNALKVSLAPMPGTAAPRSRNLAASDVSELKKIDSSELPDPRLHQTRIADAVAQGRPQVIVFASPGLCTSRVCGPVVDVVRTLIPAYADRVAFVHQEFWQPGFPPTPTPTAMEWNLRSEPWVFVVDGHGLIRARFEGVTTRHELDAAVRRMLGVE